MYELRVLVNKATDRDILSLLFLKKHYPYQLLKPASFLLKLRCNKASKNDQAILQFLIKKY